MIFGVGTDMTTVARLAALLQRHPARGPERILAPGEQSSFAQAADPSRFLAKRFAAKEALAKALGTGVREPVLLTAIEIAHEPSGKPYFRFGPELDRYLADRGLTPHLSLSDEGDQIIAFVVVEKS